MKKAKEHSERYGTIIRAARRIGFGVVAGGCICCFASPVCFPITKMQQVLSCLESGFDWNFCSRNFYRRIGRRKLSRQRGLLYGSIAGLVLFFLFLISNLSIRYPSFSWVAFTRMGVMILSGAIGGLLAVSKKRKRKSGLFFLFGFMVK